MESIFKDDKKRKISKTEDISFNVKTSGLYLVEISAIVKNEKQLDGTDDEDLRIEIDKRKFPQLSNSERYFDSPASFSGGTSKELNKTIYFILPLNADKHEISLIPDISAILVKIEVFKISEITSLDELNLPLNDQAEDGDRRSWITFVLIDLSLNKFTAEFNLKRRFIDSDDVKIIIDGEIKRNNRSILHKLWYFAASILTGENQTEDFVVNLSEGLHYIEYIIKATNFWNNFFLTQTYPPLELLDPNLVKAIIYRESRLGYFPDKSIIDVMQVWDPENPSRDAILGKTPANEFINQDEIGHLSYSYPPDRNPPKVETREESIFWGVRWLYHKAQYILENDDGTLIPPYVRKWRNWKEAVRSYNGNPELVEEYIKEVFSVYEKGVDLEGNTLW